MKSLPRTDLKKVDMLIKKEKGLIRKIKAIAKFKEPVLLLERRNMEIEVFEDVTQKRFQFEHSDPDIGETYIELKKPFDFPYGDSSFKCYVAHEDNYTSDPMDNKDTAEMIKNTLANTLSAKNEWMIKQNKVINQRILYIILGIGGLLLIFVMFGNQIIPLLQNLIPEKTAETVVTVAENVTQVPVF